MTDPYRGISKCIIHALEGMGLPAPGLESLRDWIGPPLLESFADYFESLGVEADVPHALALYRERFSSVGLFENQVYPGIPGLLEQLQARRLKLFLATAKPVVFARRIIAHFKLGQWLDGIYGSELDGRRTDKAELLQYIIDTEGLAPEACLMIGDRRHDMLAANYHSITAAGVLWGYGSRQELLTAGAEFLIGKPQQILAILDRIKQD